MTEPLPEDRKEVKRTPMFGTFRQLWRQYCDSTPRGEWVYFCTFSAFIFWYLWASSFAAGTRFGHAGASGLIRIPITTVLFLAWNMLTLASIVESLRLIRKGTIYNILVTIPGFVLLAFLAYGIMNLIGASF